LTGDGPADIHEGATDEDKEAVHEEAVSCIGNVVDLSLKIVVRFVGIDEIFEGSSIEDDGEAVGD